MRRFMLLVGMGYALVAANACRARPDTPLTIAAASNDAEAVRRLLAAGHRPDEGGDALTDVTDRPLFGGCRPETVRALFAHDATLKIPKSLAGRQAIWWARFHGCEEVLRMVGFEQASAAHQAVAGVGLLRAAIGARKLEATVERIIETPDPKPQDAR